MGFSMQRTSAGKIRLRCPFGLNFYVLPWLVEFLHLKLQVILSKYFDRKMLWENCRSFGEHNGENEK